MTATVGADDLGAGHAKGPILMAGDGTRDAVEVGGPSAARLKLVRGLVERRVAAGACVHAL